MKINTYKNVKNGKYIVNIKVTDFTTEEKDKMFKFGAPIIKVSPHFVQNGMSSNYIQDVSLKILDLWISFSEKRLADIFVNSVKQKIETAAKELKSSKDDFSGEDTYEI